MKKLMFLFAMCFMAIAPAFSQDDTYYNGDEATVVVKAQEAPPPLPTYVQPPCPGDGYLWNPGYWAWSGTGYYWVPGVWVMPPSVGLLWTPGYWGFYGGYYGWHRGYWGEHIGYYGGVNYGFGYFGSGFYGGRWEGGHFRYNTAVWHVGGGVHNTYVSREGYNPHVVNHASFNGPHGVAYRPATHEVAVMHENHTEISKEQVNHEHAMSSERGQFAHTNNNRPVVHTMSAPNGQRFDARGHVAAVHAAPAGHAGGGGHGGGGRR